jgi:D-alanyl-D-alanine carboxypeptidase
MGKRPLMSENSPEPLRALRKGQLMRGIGMMLRPAGLGLLVGAVLMASSGASAGPALVFEPYNGTVFYAEDPDAQWFPASLTKLMTAYVAFQALKAGTVTPDTKLICSKEATEQAPSKLWLKVGESITLDVALKVLIVESANDVAVMIAEGVAGSQEAFVQRMNETAQHLGMRRTNFANVNGLPDERQVTTARDLAKLARAIIIAFPEHADLFTTVQVQVGKQIMRTHNGLLVSLPGADGMKTGFICDSGFNVVASATRDGRKLVAVVLGEQSLATRRVRATELLENGFKRYFWKSLFGTSIDGLAIQQASLTDGPPHLKDARRRQTQAVRYAQGHSQGQSQGRLDHVRFGSLADIGQPIRDVRFAPESGHVQRRTRCLLAVDCMHPSPLARSVGAFLDHACKAAIGGNQDQRSRQIQQKRPCTPLFRPLQRPQSGDG